MPNFDMHVKSPYCIYSKQNATEVALLSDWNGSACISIYICEIYWDNQAVGMHYDRIVFAFSDVVATEVALLSDWNGIACI